METRLDVIMRTAQLAEDLNYEVFGLAEGWTFDSTLVLGAVAAHTSRIKLASLVLSIWGRTPGTIAMNALTLQELSGGRYVLGLGASTPSLAEGFHDVRFERSAARLRDVTTKVRHLLEGGRTEPSVATQVRPLRLGLTPSAPIPIWHGTVGPRAVAVTAATADVWHPVWLSRDGVASKRAELQRIRLQTDPTAEPLIVAAGPTVVVNPDAAEARAAAGAMLAWYMCSMGDLHPRFVASQGYEDAVRAIRAANPRLTPSSGVVPPEATVLLEQFTVTGDVDEVRDQLAAWDEAMDIVMVGLPPAGSPWEDIERTLRAGAP